MWASPKKKLCTLLQFHPLFLLLFSCLSNDNIYLFNETIWPFIYFLQAAQQQKFREIQEVERRKRFEDQRARDSEKFIQVEERRRVSFYSFLFNFILMFLYWYKHLGSQNKRLILYIYLLIFRPSNLLSANAVEPFWKKIKNEKGKFSQRKRP